MPCFMRMKRRMARSICFATISITLVTERMTLACIMSTSSLMSSSSPSLATACCAPIAKAAAMPELITPATTEEESVNAENPTKRKMYTRARKRPKTNTVMQIAGVDSPLSCIACSTFLRIIESSSTGGTALSFRFSTSTRLATALRTRVWNLESLAKSDAQHAVVPTSAIAYGDTWMGLMRTPSRTKRTTTNRNTSPRNTPSNNTV
mmetsp:Transcript_48034/g.114343  ORF Transcript_48034/g.114343 Transcript_48034/m.114343 type:complete len:207 (-) Transcript_48034:7825-8445(-)